MTDAAKPNPYAPPQVASESVLLPKPTPSQRLIRRWVIVECLVIAGALAAQGIDIESILVSGALFALIGFAITIMARRASHWFATVFGASAIAFTVFIFLLITVANWGPSEATRPVIILSWLYTIVIAPVALRSLHPPPSQWTTAASESEEAMKIAAPVAELPVAELPVAELPGSESPDTEIPDTESTGA